MGKKKRKGQKFIRRVHKWFSIVLMLFIVVFVLSGIVMNHRSLFSGVDVPRNYLLDDYQYSNWNNAAVKGSLKIDTNSFLVYGNIGVWKTDSAFRSFSSYNQGFPPGIDNRKIFKLFLASTGDLYAATLFGLYIFQKDLKKWACIEIPVHDKGVVDIVEAKGRVYFLTRSYLLLMDQKANIRSFEKLTLPPSHNDQNKTSLFKTLWVIHSGEIAGLTGKLFVDLMGLLFAFLSVTGLIYWLFPKWIKKRKLHKKGFLNLKKINVFSLKWHNKIGVWTIVFLLLTTITGIFLRPPLLIAIANAQVEKIPFTILDDPNPWYDQLRRIVYDEDKDVFIVGTNGGFYLLDESMSKKMMSLPVQPPISVMGINVFEQMGQCRYLVGSFNGLFLWDPFVGMVVDYYKPGKSVNRNSGGPPLSEHMTAGFIRTGQRTGHVFDYNHGLEDFPQSKTFPAMPKKIIDNSPMSLWNLALEFHTGRYYSFIMGRLYILFIPLFGLSMIGILLTGFILWWRIYRRNVKRKS